jgi:hypothetical protein
LRDRLHAIWFVPLDISSCKFTKLLIRYCIPMDNVRPELDSKYFDDICPDKNGTSKHKFMNWGPTRATFQVPVIAVFTKFDQLKRDIRIKSEDQHRHGSRALLNTEVERIFNEHYLANLRGPPPFVRLESEDFVN